MIQQRSAQYHICSVPGKLFCFTWQRPTFSLVYEPSRYILSKDIQKIWIEYPPVTKGMHHRQQRSVHSGPIVFQNASSSKLNFRFVGRLIVNHCECHNLVIRSAIEVHELLMESLFDKLSNKSGPISISRGEGLQIIKICCCFWWVLRHRRGHVIHSWDPDPSWRMPQICGEEFEEAQERPPPWPPP